jgi:hydroxymethylpyrimidine/phosphomethylpyrimidine kinase
MPQDHATHRRPIVLSFAASDPTGGAGVQADLLTLASLGCHPLSVITAITVQDTAGIEGILPIDEEWVADQARCLLEDMPVAAFKLGLLGSVENIAAIAAIVADYPDIPLIFDPVLASGRGDALADEDMIEAMHHLLLPQTTIITPNSLEARRLTLNTCDEAEDGDESEGESSEDEDISLAQQAQPTLDECARRLITAGCEHVLITGTHENTSPVVNTLYGSHGAIRSDKWPRLPGSYHGSGCTLASAIAAHLALGLELTEAIRAAQDYTWHTLAAAFRPGMGQHLPDRHYRIKQTAQTTIDDSTSR